MTPPAADPGEIPAEANGLEKDAEPGLESGRRWHDAGVAGDAAAVVRAEGVLRRLVREEPTNVLARVYLGSVLTLRARDARFPATRLRWAREGLALMDRAVEEAPDSVEVRFARAANNGALPAVLGRRKTARRDTEWLWGQVRAADRSGLAADNGFRQSVALMWGAMLAGEGDRDGAVRVYREGLGWDPESEAAERFREALTGLERRRGRR